MANEWLRFLRYSFPHQKEEEEEENFNLSTKGFIVSISPYSNVRSSFLYSSLEAPSGKERSQIHSRHPLFDISKDNQSSSFLVPPPFPTNFSTLSKRRRKRLIRLIRATVPILLIERQKQTAQPAHQSRKW